MAERTENATYLATKRQRMHHDDPGDAGLWSRLLAGDVPAQAVSSSDRVLLSRYGPLAGDGPHTVIAQLAQSLDGFIASRTGQAQFVSGAQDREHLHRLRALVDAVVVGAATVLSDDPRLTVRSVPGDNPTRVVLDPRGRVPIDARVFGDGAAPTLWVRGTAEPDQPSKSGKGPTGSGSVELVELTLDAHGRFDPQAVVQMLRERGLGRVLVEGGGVTVSRFLDAGVLDRFYLTSAPLLIGDGVPGVRFDGEDSLSGAIRPTVRRYQLGEDVCSEIDFTGSASRSW